eukprot:2996201-Prymnesium_polylepis.1
MREPPTDVGAVLLAYGRRSIDVRVAAHGHFGTAQGRLRVGGLHRVARKAPRRFLRGAQVAAGEHRRELFQILSRWARCASLDGGGAVRRRRRTTRSGTAPEAVSPLSVLRDLRSLQTVVLGGPLAHKRDCSSSLPVSGIAFGRDSRDEQREPAARRHRARARDPAVFTLCSRPLSHVPNVPSVSRGRWPMMSPGGGVGRFP